MTRTPYDERRPRNQQKPRLRNEGALQKPRRFSSRLGACRTPSTAPLGPHDRRSRHKAGPRRAERSEHAGPHPAASPAGAAKEAKKKIGTLEVQVTQAKADVFLDGVPVGISPLSAPLFARPGHHSLRVELDGYEPVLESFTLSAGETRTISIDLPKRGAGMATTSPSPASPGEISDPRPPAREPLPLWPAIAGGSVAVLGLGAFVGLRVAAGNDKDDAERLAKLHGSSGCSDAGSRADTCGEQSDAAEAYDEKINASNVSLAIGSAALVGTLAFYLWPRNSKEERVGKKSSGIQIGGMAASGAASVWASGTFE